MTNCILQYMRKGKICCLYIFSNLVLFFHFFKLIKCLFYVWILCVCVFPCSIKQIKITTSPLRRFVVYSISCNVDQTKPVLFFQDLTFIIYYLFLNTFYWSTEKANEHYGLAQCPLQVLYWYFTLNLFSVIKCCSSGVIYLK